MDNEVTQENYQRTSDLNFVAFLAAKGKQSVEQTATFKERRVRIWFLYNMTKEEFNKFKDAYFQDDPSNNPDCLVPAFKLFQQRDRAYAIMSHCRQEAEQR